MKKVIKKLHASERGVVLIIVLILLAIGGLTIAPMLSHMSTGLKSGQIYERKTDEYYAADAGVEDGLWQIIRKERDLHLPDDEGDLDWNYTITAVNGKTVDVSIDYVDENADGYDVYKIISVAGADGSDTTIVSYAIFGGGFAFLLDHAITSTGQVDLKNASTVTGGIMSPVEPTGNGTWDFYVEEDVESIWPDNQSMYDFYRSQVTDTGILDLTIDSTGYSFDSPLSVGPLYVNGKLTLQGSGWIRLDGPVFVTGDLKANNAFQMILNNETIFVGDTTDDTVDLSNGITTSGAGCIISVGDLHFKTGGETDPNGFCVLLSIEGKVVLHQGDPIYGCVIGREVVTLDNGSSVFLNPLPDSLNFPNYAEGDYTGYNLQVRTWETS